MSNKNNGEILEELNEKLNKDDVIEILNEEVKNQANVITKLFSLIKVTTIIASSLNKKEVLKSILDQTKIPLLVGVNYSFKGRIVIMK